MVESSTVAGKDIFAEMQNMLRQYEAKADFIQADSPSALCIKASNIIQPVARQMPYPPELGPLMRECAKQGLGSSDHTSKKYVFHSFNKGKCLAHMPASDPACKILAAALDRAREVNKKSGARVSDFAAFWYKKEQDSTLRDGSAFVKVLDASNGVVKGEVHQWYLRAFFSCSRTMMVEYNH